MTVEQLTTHPNAPKLGKVALVGAGPGDPELLTIKALKIIQNSDVILYDRLVSKEILELFPRKTPAIYVGKEKKHHSIPQDKLNDLLVSKAKQGLNICRLKGGDSFIFGRGGEEMLKLKSAGIEVELIPGITAASGCTSYAGIPLTHRGISQGCTMVTAHGEKELNLNWEHLAKIDHTLVFYMGLSKSELISTQLQLYGMPANTPVAFIENGCYPNQRVIRGQLHELPLLAKKEHIQSPALIIVGDVVNLADQLAWLSDKELTTQDHNEVQKLSA
ncbi:MAG: uroporphyrinogen-III C-methyltransferase [Porticoccus sp.]|nr:uroporphyrinogen-III C-methyltransferase [Porticoccus sp.]